MVNQLGDMFTTVIAKSQEMIPVERWSDAKFCLTDSMPIIIAQQGRRCTAKVFSILLNQNAGVY